MLMFVGLFCVYLALWQLTATQGVRHVIATIYGDDVYGDDTAPEEWGINSWTPMPMIVQLTEPHPVGLGSFVILRRYYLWYIFGVVRLPFQADDPPGPAVG